MPLVKGDSQMISTSIVCIQSTLSNPVHCRDCAGDGRLPLCVPRPQPAGQPPLQLQPGGGPGALRGQCEGHQAGGQQDLDTGPPSLLQAARDHLQCELGLQQSAGGQLAGQQPAVSSVQCVLPQCQSSSGLDMSCCRH